LYSSVTLLPPILIIIMIDVFLNAR
jgi:hypothetical protein